MVLLLCWSMEAGCYSAVCLLSLVSVLVSAVEILFCSVAVETMVVEPAAVEPVVLASAALVEVVEAVVVVVVVLVEVAEDYPSLVYLGSVEG
jgi:hypothetical protein